MDDAPVRDIWSWYFHKNVWVCCDAFTDKNTKVLSYVQFCIFVSQYKSAQLCA